MKTRGEVTAEKLRGGFYTPPRLVAHAVERLSELLGSHSDIKVLEPSIGDGNFVDGLASSGLRISELVGVEVLPSEAAKARQRIDRAGIVGSVVNESALSWSLNTSSEFDAVVGNLPFVRFQFLSERDRADATQHAADLGVSIGGVSNLWLPMLLASLRRLKQGGVFVLVLPAECLTGVSAGSAREWLLQNVAQLRCDLYPAGSFPGALQEVVLVSGRIRDEVTERGSLSVASHSRLHSDDSFSNLRAAVTSHVLAGRASWTRCLLAPTHLDALAEFESLDAVQTLGRVAKFEVATVTGANAFFSLTAEDVEAFDLWEWVRPLLPRSRHAPGVIYTEADFELSRRHGVASYLFDAGLGSPDRDRHAGLDRYLAHGEAQGLHERYKCRIRSPWWAVPGIRRGDLLLSKRCHRHPRMIANETDAVTTDTIYRGRTTLPGLQPRAISAAFHNSGTFFTAELEGRNFGGGVLELVPSEVARLRVPVTEKLLDEIDRLDRISRECAVDQDSAGETLRYETDLLLRKAGIGVTASMLDNLSDARALLLDRRLDRGSVDREAQF